LRFCIVDLLKTQDSIGFLNGRRPYLFIDGSSGAAKKTDSSKNATSKLAIGVTWLGFFLAELSLNYISGLFESAGIKNSYHNQKHACLLWQHTR
jgi:hypothetical protein